MLVRLTVCLLVLLASAVVSANEKNGWLDTFYQYRIPFETHSEQAGWAKISLTPETITASINAAGRFQYDPRFFAFNAVKLVEVNEQGRPVNRHPEAGFYFTRLGKDRAQGWQKAGKSHVIEVVKDKYHLMDFVSSEFGKNPGYKYETIFPPGSAIRDNDYRVSYFPPLLPRVKTPRQLFFVPDRNKMTLIVGGIWIGKLHQVAVHEVRVDLEVKLDRPGAKRWMLYYQPMCSHNLQTPKLERKGVTQLQLDPKKIGAVEQHFGQTIQSLAGTAAVRLAFAASTVKVTRKMRFPVEQGSGVTIRAAANERQSFQLLVQARTSSELKNVQASDLQSGQHVIRASKIRIRRVEFVRIAKSSYITPAKLLGDIGDPLVPVGSPKLGPGETTSLWITVAVPPKTPAGVYKGKLQVELSRGPTLTVPVSLEVFDFELPEFSSFRANMGMQYIGNRLNYKRQDARALLDYHGISKQWPRDVGAFKRLARLYFDAMVENKFTPKSVALYAEIGMKWTPPPQGYNVDKPGNFFKLHDWDFSEFNETLRYYIDKKKVNNVCLTHTDPTACSLFQQLPGRRVSKPKKSVPHITTGWHTFREITIITYNKTKADPYQKKSIEVTPKQWDDLIRKYYRRMAENLAKHGWLDKFHILIDETEHPKRLQHFLKLLKSDPLTARIRTAACIQGLGLIQRKSPASNKEYDFRGLIDIYVPEIDENYDRWMDYYWKDHELSRSRDKLWPYLVVSSRLAIDTPGINNRVIGLDIFQRGGSGLLIWETTGWDHLYGKSRNPWQDPYTRHANGSLAFFYPPKREGLAKKPNFTITPSLRLETFRESIDDYEYARMLEDLVKTRRAQGRNVSKGETVLHDINRFFASNTHWSQNDAWYLSLRLRMARAIEALKRAR